LFIKTNNPPLESVERRFQLNAVHGAVFELSEATSKTVP